MSDDADLSKTARVSPAPPTPAEEVKQAQQAINVDSVDDIFKGTYLEHMTFHSFEPLMRLEGRQICSKC